MVGPTRRVSFSETPVDDLAEAIQFIIENDINDDLLNVGSGEEISIYELSLLIKKILNYQDYNHLPIYNLHL